LSLNTASGCSAGSGWHQAEEISTSKIEIRSVQRVVNGSFPSLSY